MPTALDLAQSMLGENETINHDDVQRYLATGGAGMDPAKAAWCAAFVNSTLNQSGQQGTGSNMARSFLGWGQPVSGAPSPGDVAVFPRGGANSPYGHVGFVQGYDPKTGMISLLAGNQGNAVSVAQYPLSAALGIRRAGSQPAGVDTPSPQAAIDAASPGNLPPQAPSLDWMSHLDPSLQHPQQAQAPFDPLQRWMSGQNPFADNPLESFGNDLRTTMIKGLSALFG
jgi:uncharacterized protein (TIGR02594 family)